MQPTLTLRERMDLVLETKNTKGQVQYCTGTRILRRSNLYAGSIRISLAVNTGNTQHLGENYCRHWKYTQAFPGQPID